MNSVRDPGYCAECGEPLVPDLRQCPKCRAPNPGFMPFLAATRIRPVPVPEVPPPSFEETAPSFEDTSPSLEAASPSLEEASPSFEETPPSFESPLPPRFADPPAEPAAFESVLAEMAQAQASGCHVIANIGLTEAGKSWLIARMGKLSGGTYRASLYSSDGQVQHAHLMSSQLLPRTAVDQAYIWHLEPGPGNQRNRSGSWRIVDIAGELVADLSFIPKIAAGSGLHDLLLMILAQARALVIVIDGLELARSLEASPEPEPPVEERRVSLDERYAEIVNELVRLLRFVDEWQRVHGAACTNEQLVELKRAISDNPQLQVSREAAAPGRAWLSIPTLFVISKADALVRLEPTSQARFAPPGPDALHFAEQYFPATLERALHNIATFRWAFAAPFVGQPDLTANPRAGDRSLRLDFERASFGVKQAMQWLDSELLDEHDEQPLTVRDAVHDVRRWLPRWLARGRVR